MRAPILEDIRKNLFLLRTLVSVNKSPSEAISQVQQAIHTQHSL
jgi:hypothetical protein